MSAELLFSRAQTNDPSLVFGETGGPPPVFTRTVDFVADLPALTSQVEVSQRLLYEAEFVSDLPGLSVSVEVVVGTVATVVADLPGLTIDIAPTYDSRTSRPLVNDVASPWQPGQDFRGGVDVSWQEGIDTKLGVESWWDQAVPVDTPARIAWLDGLRRRDMLVGKFTDADNVRGAYSSPFEDGVRLRNDLGSRYEHGDPRRTLRQSLFQDGYRDRRNVTGSAYQDGVGVYFWTSDSGAAGLPLRIGADSSYQEAMKPGAGIWVPPQPPQPDPCYLPDPALVFSQTPDGPALLFVCERHGPGPDPEPGATVVVPVQRVYIVVNSANLIRVSNGATIRTLGMSMSLDVDSWTWSFNASVRAEDLALVDSGDGDPVEVQATVNGTAFRFIVEKISRERTFGAASLRVTGRGRAAFLDAPYSPIFTFRNTESRTAQQLMADVLTLNGTPLPWTVNWTPEDWSVPAGVFTHQGSYISALNAIVGSIGAYIRPHPSAQSLTVLNRYPSAPWAWGSLTPDFELPADVTVREGIEWQDKPVYNRVYVGGVGAGVFGPVTRAGTDGALLAPQVVEPLITAAAAHRQRGTRVLADTGRQAQVSLSLPVLSETGVIQPGSLVRYVDGGVTRLGLTRAVNVQVGQSAVDMRQTIVLETHL